jgi:acetyltransferase-like isoleucine patch superfamily enzyme
VGHGPIVMGPLAFARRLRERLAGPRCVRDPTARFYATARVHDNAGKGAAIRVGPHTHVRGELMTFGHGGQIEMGSYCHLGEQSRIWSARRIVIGDRVLISHQVNIFDSDTHPFGPRARHAQFQAIITTGHPDRLEMGEAPVALGDDVLVGCMAIILKGVTVGTGAVIGAGSVVTKDVPEWTVVAGNPARVLRELTPEERRS